MKKVEVSGHPTWTKTRGFRISGKKSKSRNSHIPKSDVWSDGIIDDALWTQCGHLNGLYFCKVKFITLFISRDCAKYHADGPPY